LIRHHSALRDATRDKNKKYYKDGKNIHSIIIAENTIDTIDMERDLRETAEKVHSVFKRNRYTLSVAESCTGGFISHLITTLPGASDFFKAGVVSYSTSAKRSILGVPQSGIQKYGVVSAETAREMAEKMRELAKTDFSISTTGNLGPDVLEGKDMGLVFTAVSGKEETRVKELRLKGTRWAIKKAASLLSLQFLIECADKRRGRRRSTRR